MKTSGSWDISIEAPKQMMFIFESFIEGYNTPTNCRICGIQRIWGVTMKHVSLSGSRHSRAPSQIPEPACPDGWRLVSEPIVFQRVSSPHSVCLSSFFHPPPTTSHFCASDEEESKTFPSSAEFERCYVSVAFGRDDDDGGVPRTTALRGSCV